MDTRIAWFGAGWDGAYFGPEIAIPIGESCAECGLPILDTDQGVAPLSLHRHHHRIPFHYTCWRTMLLQGHVTDSRTQ